MRNVITVVVNLRSIKKVELNWKTCTYLNLWDSKFILLSQLWLTISTAWCFIIFLIWQKWASIVLRSVRGWAVAQTHCLVKQNVWDKENLILPFQHQNCLNSVILLRCYISVHSTLYLQSSYMKLHKIILICKDIISESSSRPCQRPAVYDWIVLGSTNSV